MMNDLQDCYRTLKLESGATWTDVKRSYRELVRVWHPDRFAHEPALERNAQEKLKLINLAFERLEEFFRGNEERAEPPPKKPDRSKAEEFFFEGQRLFFGNGVAKDAVRAAVLLRKSADMGFAPAQYLLGHAYYSGQGLSKSADDAALWWTKAAGQLHAEAQYSLGCLYHAGHSAGMLARVVKSAVDWQVADSRIEAYKWLNLAITYGVGMEGGLAKEQVSLFLTEKQRNEARSRASAFYPKYPKISSEDVFDQLFTRFLEEGNSPSHMEMHNFFSKMQSKTGGLNKFRSDVREKGLEHLKNTFLGDALTKTGGFFKAVGAAWSPKRSSEDWGRLIAGNIIEFPYDYLSDTFIQRRENAINRIWLNLMRR
ncbi:MAG: DnaJ domain-containing protein [Chloroflexi bacterium]|nr:DnaJ domain-containing protein [Chloroflexota bacterium]